MDTYCHVCGDKLSPFNNYCSSCGEKITFKSPETETQNSTIPSGAIAGCIVFLTIIIWSVSNEWNSNKSMAVSSQSSSLKEYFDNRKDESNNSNRNVPEALTNEEQVLKDFVSEMQSQGTITEIDKEKMEVWVNPVHWQAGLDAQAKESFIGMMADYMKYFNETNWHFSEGRPEITIYDGQSGKEIAGYGIFSGVYINN